MQPMIIDDSLALMDEPDDLNMSAVYDKIVMLPENGVIAIRKRPIRSPRTEAFSAKILNLILFKMFKIYE